MPRGARDEEFHGAIVEMLSHRGLLVADPEVDAVRLVSPPGSRRLTVSVRDLLDRMAMPNRTPDLPDSPRSEGRCWPVYDGEAGLAGGPGLRAGAVPGPQRPTT